MADVDRRARVAQLVARHGPDVGRLCDACVAELPGVAGAGLAVMSTMPVQQVRYTSNPVSARVEELQLVLGEGPCKDAYTGGQPVLATDLRNAHWSQRWPAFVPAALDVGAEAVFALPLQVGPICVGVIDLYRPGPGSLAGDDLDEAMAFADAATELLLAESLPGGQLPGTLRLLSHRAVVHQATGMISAQLGIPVEDAFLRLRAYVFVTERSLDEVADDVVARRLRFTDGGEGDST